ncbi:hypothetical protein RGQ29_021571 [Quercus rubra]|uniref:NB-ARC domain-containing protein n=1 Tax=Quercus rubra TaxID=3512 RepID=A0AAN7IYM6_QUERU|nr:hypothetical protein RGQ29_021571 [Quercus rubra]
MEVSVEFMDVAVSIPRLLHKLQNLPSYNPLNSNVPVREAVAELGLVSRSIREAEEGQITLHLDILFWKELQSGLRNLEHSIDTFIVKAELRKRNLWNKVMSLIPYKSMRGQSDIGDEMEKLIPCAKKVRQHTKLGPTGATSSRPQPTQPRNSDYLVSYDSDFVVPYDKVDELVNQLFDPKKGELDTVIVVTGMAGSGKTVLAKRVCSMKVAEHRFHSHAWVNFSVDYEGKDFLVDILKQLSRERVDENLQDNELESMLEIVDDVRTPYDLDKLSVVLKCIGGRSRLILTTRSQDVARAASRWRNPISLRRLTDEEGWTLFLKKARIAEDSLNSPELINLQKDILRQCDGSPWAILVLGGILSTKDLSNWRSQENILALSYQDLSSRVKCCFLYFGLFPRAVEIPIRRLFYHWRAEGWVTPLPEEHIDDIDLAWEILKQLISRNLIEVEKAGFAVSPKRCRMPGSIWDVFHPKAECLNLFRVHNNIAYTSAQSPEVDIWRLVEYAGIRNYPSLDPYILSLRSWVSFNTRKRDSPNEEIGLFLKNIVNSRGFGMLILLDLEHVFKPVLHETIGKLLLLKYLGLRWTSLDALPISVGNLPYLETLDVKHTNITNLPNSIGKAKNLRYLYLNDSDMSFRMPNIGYLTNLQSLSGLFIGNKSLVNNCLSKLRGLKKLKLTCSSRSAVRELADSISQLSDLQSLRLRSIDLFDQPSILELGAIAEHQKLYDLYLLGQLPRDYSFPPNLKALTLSASEIERDPMHMLGQLRHLNSLRLLGRSYAGQQMTCLCEGFPELRILKLWKLENLEEWIVEEGSMPILRELEIRCCNRLQPPEGLQLIIPLKEVILTNMSDEFVANFKRVLPCRRNISRGKNSDEIIAQTSSCVLANSPIPGKDSAKSSLLRLN